MRIFFNLILRKFLKSKGLNLLNLLGLSVGIIASLLIVIYADHEFSYDNFHPDAERIFRMEGKTNGDQWFSNLGMEHGKELISGKYPEVKGRVQLRSGGRAFISYQDKKFAEKEIYQTDPGSSFFEFFGFNLLEGNRESLLTAPHSVVLTKSTAERYFGSQSAVGESLNYDTLLLKVTGVVEDIPSNSHLAFDFIYTNPTGFSRDHYHSQTYLYLENGVDPSDLEKKVLDMEGIASNEFHELSDVKLVKVPDIHLKSDVVFGTGGKGDMLQIIVFLVIGGLILFIAVANYINLSLAIYLSKGREVGIRKVFGESRTRIILSFVYESFTRALLTLPFVLLGLALLLPVFSDYLSVRLENKLLYSPTYWLSSLGFLAFVSFVTVIYPASALSTTAVSSLIKSKSAMNITGGTNYRNALILVQFVLLFTLGISAWFMNRQISYLDNKEMGFDASKVIKISNAFEIGDVENYELFKTKLLSYPQIGAVAFGPMMGDNMNPLAYKVQGVDETYENLLSYGVDVDYFDVMGMEITHGNFKEVLSGSEDGQIVSLVNSNFIERFGWQEEPIGKRITLRPGSENELNRKVSGVFTDFHFFTLKEKITPQIISLRRDPSFVNTNILVRGGVGDLQEVAKIMEAQWYEVQPNVPMEFEYMEEAVKLLYARERQTGVVSVMFSLLAVVLSVLGLIGFMIYIIGLKSKEITVRKVLGASLLQIIGVLNRRLFLVIFIAAVVGSGLSYWLISSWLQDYAYSISINPVVFLVALVIVYVIVFLITATRSLKWASDNPISGLSSE